MSSTLCLATPKHLLFSMVTSILSSSFDQNPNESIRSYDEMNASLKQKRSFLFWFSITVEEFEENSKIDDFVLKIASEKQKNVVSDLIFSFSS